MSVYVFYTDVGNVTLGNSTRLSRPPNDLVSLTFGLALISFQNFSHCRMVFKYFHKAKKKKKKK